MIVECRVWLRLSMQAKQLLATSVGKVVCLGRLPEESSAIAALLSEYGRERVLPVTIDLTDPSSVDAAAAQIHKLSKGAFSLSGFLSFSDFVRRRRGGAPGVLVCGQSLPNITTYCLSKPIQLARCPTQLWGSIQEGGTADRLSQLGSAFCAETGDRFAGRVDMLLNVAAILGDGKTTSVFSRHRLQLAVVF
jgi:NAD(P)-dependent dehydrogenase (short-subunit alcohol dehydrogenase family)